MKEKEIEEKRLTLTPETYLGYLRADRYSPDIVIRGDEEVDYNFSPPLFENGVGIKGKWRIGPENITALGENNILELNFIATKVFLVLGGKAKAPIKVFLDGKPLSKDYYTKDMNELGEITVDSPRKYDIVDLKGHYGRHTLSLEVPRGIKAYVFTFGE